MEKFRLRRLTPWFLVLGLLFVGCGKKSPSAQPTFSPSPAGANNVVPTPTPASPLTGKVTPVTVTQDAGSVASYLHYPEQQTAQNSIVQFYCDITENGIVASTYGLVGKDAAFRTAVQSALDWGRFAPATVDGHAISAYIGGTVIFGHKDNKPVIVVTLTTYDHERIEKFADYIQPQLVGGLRPQIEKVMRNIAQGIPAAGRAEVIVKVDARGGVTSTKVVVEYPLGSGLGTLLNNAVAGAQFTPAYDNGKAAPGTLDVVVDFSQL